VSALEEQLTLQAQESAHEIARLRTKLFEHEMDAMLREPADGETGMDDLLLDAVPGGAVPSGSAAQAVKALNAAAAAAGGGGSGGGGVGGEETEGVTSPGAGDQPEPESKNPEETGAV